MKLIKFFTIALFSVFISCATDENSQSEKQNTNINIAQKSSKSIISPDGFILAKDEDQLKRTLFGTQVNVATITISKINFYTLGKTDGAAAIIDYVQGGVKRNIAITAGNFKVTYSSSATVLNNPEAVNESLSTTYSCGGQGCCYVGGTLDPNTGVPTSFTCKCEGNPNGNSGCSLTVTNSDKTLKAE